MFTWAKITKKQVGAGLLLLILIQVVVRLIVDIVHTLFRFNIENLAQKLGVDNVFGSGWFMIVWNLATDSHVFTFALGAVIFAFWDTIGNFFKRVYSAITGRQIASSKGHMDDPNYAYQQRILAIAQGLLDSTVRGRVRAAQQRMKDKRIDRMVDGMSREQVRCDDLTSADFNKLTPRQTKLLTEYKQKEYELRFFIDETVAGKHAGAMAATSFDHRLTHLAISLEDLINDWYK